MFPFNCTQDELISHINNKSNTKNRVSFFNDKIFLIYSDKKPVRHDFKRKK